MGDEIYCICRSSDVNRFMIGCDHCNDWFHGNCVDIKERESKYIKRYYCDECRSKNPNLAVVFRSKYKDVVKDLKSFRERVRRRDRSKSPEVTHSSSKDRPKERKEKETEAERERRKQKERERESEQEREREERRRQKRKEEKRREEKEKQRKQKLKQDEEGDRRRKEEQAKRDQLEQEQAKALKEAVEKQQQQERAATERQSSTEGRKREREEDSVDGRPSKKPVLTERNILSSDEDEDDAWQPPAAPARTSVADKRGKNVGKKPKQKPPVRQKKRRGRRLNDSTSEEEPEVDLTPKQCFGPTCIKSARVGSKYCSDRCGINLATTRLHQTLPERIREYNSTPSFAENRDKKKLESLRKQQDDAKDRLQELNQQFMDLEAVIAKGKTFTLDDHDSDSDSEDHVEMTIHCVTCGSNIQVDTAIRHMERCYNKVESQTSFASKFKTSIEDNRLFCDFYNSKEQSYCKRLKVLCPEHNPDPKAADEEVCGYPFQSKLFAKDVSSFCRKAKKSCTAHFCWEKLRRAEIDMERVKQYMKIDELFDQERQVRERMSNRAGVLSLLLHSTFNHDLGRWHQMQQAQQQKGVQKPTSKAQ